MMCNNVIEQCYIKKLHTMLYSNLYNIYVYDIKLCSQFCIPYDTICYIPYLFLL